MPPTSRRRHQHSQSSAGAPHQLDAGLGGSSVMKAALSNATTTCSPVLSDDLFVKCQTKDIVDQVTKSPRRVNGLFDEVKELAESSEFHGCSRETKEGAVRALVTATAQTGCCETMRWMIDHKRWHRLLLRRGVAALTAAAEKHHVGVLLMLADALGHDALLERSVEGKTVAHHAVGARNHSFFRFIPTDSLRIIFDLQPKLATTESRSGQLPVSTACKNYEELALTLFEWFPETAIYADQHPDSRKLIVSNERMTLPLLQIPLPEVAV